MAKVKECVDPDEMLWEDCVVPGHDSCKVMVCPGCNERFLDCEVA